MPTSLQPATTVPVPRNSMTAGAAVVARVRTDDAVWWVRSGWQDKLLGDGKPHWLQLTAGGNIEQVKLASGRSTFLVRLGSCGVFAKLSWSPNWLLKLKQWIRGGSALIEWRNLRVAEDRAIPCVTPVALGRSATGTGRQVLLTREVEGASTLYDICMRRCATQGSQEPALGHAQIAAVAQLLATAHERGFAHRDGHPGNILVGLAADGSVNAKYVDCYAVDIRRGGVSKGRRVRAIAQLDLFLRHCLTRSQRLRFLREYNRQCVALGASAEPVAVTRALMDRIAALQERMTHTLAGARDRRLRRDGPYFHRVNPAPHWWGVVALKLARRHLFPERGVGDRTCQQWQSVLPALLEQLGSSPPPSSKMERDGILLETVRPSDKWQALQWRWRGSEAKRVFERCHRDRHRNQPSELILGYLEYRAGSRIGYAVLIRPAALASPTDVA